VSIGLPLALWVLCVVDGAFAGYRDAAGRDGRIFKAELYRRAIRRGARYGLGVSVATALVVAIAVVSAPAPAARYDELVECARWMLIPIGAYATAVLVALGVWSTAESDLRTLASVIVLGPFTLARPYLIAAAAAVGVAVAPSVPAAIAVGVACGLQLLVGPLLGRAWSRNPRLFG
jgi:hypothetical protein